ncbi:MAG: cupin domain-containing protein [Limnochordales bacterium]|nr:MAG: cupin domain-containing protein [Bacillota bacterium]
MPDNDNVVTFRRFDPENYRWDGVELEEYKQHRGERPGEAWRDITRQVIAGRFGEPCSFRLRYFEVGPGGHSSLEKHQHIHVVMTLRGEGKVIVGDDVYETRPFDVIYVPPMTPHQFVNDGDEPYGFLCIVDGDRDKPQPVSSEELERLRSNPATAAVMRVYES